MQQANTEFAARKKSLSIRKSLRDVAYQEIKRRIVSCELRPGEAVTVPELAEALQIGRTPVIQAIDRLSVDGLVNVMPRKGIVVSPISLDEFVEIIEMRLVNEAQAVRWAAEKASRNQLLLMKKNLEATRKAARSHDVENMIALDREFHRLISDAAGNTILGEFLANLHDKALRFWFISLRAPDHDIRVCEQHAAVVEAIGNRDPSAAEKAMREHIASFHENATKQILRT